MYKEPNGAPSIKAAFDMVDEMADQRREQERFDEKLGALTEFFKLFDWNSVDADLIWDALLTQTIDRTTADVREISGGDLATITTYVADILEIITKYLKEGRYEYAAGCFIEMVDSFIP